MKQVALFYACDERRVRGVFFSRSCLSIMSSRQEVQVTIVNRLGLHARPAMSFVDTANLFQSEVRVCRDDTEVDGKSIMQMMMLAAGQGTVLTIVADGPDAAEACKALKALVDGGFEEE
jgi:phosphocarrier protein